MLEKVKLVLKITTDDFDDELNDLISACLLDLKISGVSNRDVDDPMIIRAICTYCRVNFGSPSDYDKLKASYDEQKSQLSMSSDYTNYGD